MKKCLWRHSECDWIVLISDLISKERGGEQCHALTFRLKNEYTEIWTYHYANISEFSIYRPTQRYFSRVCVYLRVCENYFEKLSQLDHGSTNFSHFLIIAICQLRFSHHCLPANLARFLSETDSHCPLQPESSLNASQVTSSLFVKNSRPNSEIRASSSFFGEGGIFLILGEIVFNGHGLSPLYLLIRTHPSPIRPVVFFVSSSMLWAA